LGPRSSSRMRGASVSRSQVMTSGRQVDYGMITLGIGVAALGVAAAALLARPSDRRSAELDADRRRRCQSAGALLGGIEGARTQAPASSLVSADMEQARPSSLQATSPTVTTARRLNRAAGMLALSVLADSAIEHYRGSFKNRVMYTPILVSLMTLAISAHGVADQRPVVHTLRDVSYAIAALTGLAGTGFHICNVATRPGSLNWVNAFYGAPLGAPSAILLSGLLGFMAERVRNAPSGGPPRLFGFPAGRFTAAVTAVGLLGTTAEAGFLHFRGAYHNPFMFIPVTIPPAAALVMAEGACGRPRNPAFSRWWLRLTALIGLAGMGFHAYGVHRNMGGWRNWRQNVLNGPPLPAPLSFAGLALAGLAALALIDEKPDA
jgi:hypothetical protein